MKKIIEGTGVALVTPFTADNRVDTEALVRLVDYVSTEGMEFLVALGTTSEAPTLTAEEKALVRETIIKANKKQLPLVVGIGGNNTQSVIDEIKRTDLSAFDAILSVVPYYNKPSQAGMYEHFAAIARSTELPIILYNVPGRVGVTMQAETTLRLARDFKNIVAIKEASGNMVLNMQLLRDKPEGFSVLSGDDMTALLTTYLGGKGVISVIAMAYPREFSEMIHLALKGEVAKANALHYCLMNATTLAFKEGNPAGVKAFLAERGICAPYVRLPLVAASAALTDEIKATL